MYAPQYRHRGLSAESMHAPHYRHRGLAAEHGIPVQPTNGLGEDLDDFRSYLGAKTTHETNSEAAVAKHSAFMEEYTELLRVLSAESAQLDEELKLLLEDPVLHAGGEDRQQQVLDALAAEVKSQTIALIRMQEHMYELTGYYL